MDVIRDDAGHSILLQVSAVPGIEAGSRVHKVVLACALLLDGGGLGPGLDRLVRIPLGAAHEKAIEATKALASSIVEAKLPLNVHEDGVGFDHNLVLLEVLLQHLKRVVSLIEASPPGVDLWHHNLEFSIVNAVSEEGLAQAKGLVLEVEPLVPVFPPHGGEGLVPSVGGLVVAEHAVAQLVNHFDSNGMLCVAGVEICHRVYLVSQ